MLRYGPLAAHGTAMPYGDATLGMSPAHPAVARSISPGVSSRRGFYLMALER
jgi:hypothetical protein